MCIDRTLTLMLALFWSAFFLLFLLGTTSLIVQLF